MTTPDRHTDIDPATLVERVEVSLRPINEGAEPGDLSSVRYPWEGMGRYGKVDIVESALAAMEAGGTLSDEANSSLERCVDSVRAEDRRNDRMDERAPESVRSIGIEKRISFNGLVARLRSVQTPAQE